MANREPEADADRPLALLHQLAGDVVDGRDMIGIDGVAQTETVGQKRSAYQQGMVAERQQCPRPDSDIYDDQQSVDADEPTAQVGGAVTVRDLTATATAAAS
jgi:hypothetical protein